MLLLKKNILYINLCETLENYCTLFIILMTTLKMSNNYWFLEAVLVLFFIIWLLVALWTLCFLLQSHILDLILLDLSGRSCKVPNCCFFTTSAQKLRHRQTSFPFCPTLALTNIALVLVEFMTNTFHFFASSDTMPIIENIFY